MQCPVDQTVLQMTDRQGVEIDYCPQCRGVWLDRGELDKIIEKSESARHAPAARPAPAPSPGPDGRATRRRALPAGVAISSTRRYPSSPDSPDDYRGGYGQGYDPRYGQKRRKKSFLGDISTSDCRVGSPARPTLTSRGSAAQRGQGALDGGPAFLISDW